MLMMLSIALLLALGPLSPVTGDVICPPEELWRWCCYCTEYTDGVIAFRAFNELTSDTKVSDMLDVLLNTPGISPVGLLDIGANYLTQVPYQTLLFPKLQELGLGANKLTVIKSGTFNFPNKNTPLRKLDLSRQNDYPNSLSLIIEPAAFVGKVLKKNQLFNLFETLF